MFYLIAGKWLLDMNRQCVCPLATGDVTKTADKFKNICLNHTLRLWVSGFCYVDSRF